MPWYNSRKYADHWLQAADERNDEDDSGKPVAVDVHHVSSQLLFFARFNLVV